MNQSQTKFEKKNPLLNESKNLNDEKNEKSLKVKIKTVTSVKQLNTCYGEPFLKR
jgi:hypothetical protein